MCGIVAVLLAQDEEAGAIPQDNCNQLIYDGLTVLQHRGQGARAVAVKPVVLVAP